MLPFDHARSPREQCKKIRNGQKIRRKMEMRISLQTMIDATQFGCAGGMVIDISPKHFP